MNTSVWNELKPLLATPEPAGLGPEQRSGVKPAAALNRELDGLFQRAPLPAASQQLIRSAVLLWHDELDASHTISQDIENPDGSFLHGIMHRREPDYWNSKYWFRRVGNHPAFPEIAKRAAAILAEPRQAQLQQRLLPRGAWDAFAFVDVCEEAARSADEALPATLRELQRIEFEVLLERFASATSHR